MNPALNTLRIFSCFGCIAVSLQFSSVPFAFAQDSVLPAQERAIGDVLTLAGDPQDFSSRPVDRRIEEEYQPVPLHWEGLVIYPEMEVSFSYDDNIFITEQNTSGDFISTIEPSLKITKNYQRHTANLELEAEVMRHASLHDEDVENGRVRFYGFLEPHHDFTLPYEIGWSSSHENRAQNFSSNFANKPLGFETVAGALGLTYKPNRLTLALVGRYSHTDYEDGVSETGQPVVRSDSNNTTVELEGLASYHFLRDHKLFLSLAGSFVDYEKRNFVGGSFNGVGRDNTGLSITAGVDTQYKELVEASMGLGYEQRTFKTNDLEDVSALKITSNFLWNATKRATVEGNISRSVAQDNEITQGIVLTQALAELDYEFRHNMFGSVRLGNAWVEFNEIDREDEVLSAGLGLRYLVSPRLSLESEYRKKRRESTQQNFDYDKDILLVRMNTRL